MDLNTKLGQQNTNTSLLPKNLEWCCRTITGINEQFKEFLAQNYQPASISNEQVINIKKSTTTPTTMKNSTEHLDWNATILMPT